METVRSDKVSHTDRCSGNAPSAEPTIARRITNVERLKSTILLPGSPGPRLIRERIRT